MALSPHVNLSVYCNCLIGRLGAVLAANFMEQSPSEEANRYSAGQETPPHFMEPEVPLPTLTSTHRPSLFTAKGSIQVKGLVKNFQTL